MRSQRTDDARHNYKIRQPVPVSRPNIAVPARKRYGEHQEDGERRSKRLRTISATPPEQEVDADSEVELVRSVDVSEQRDDEPSIKLEPGLRRTQSQARGEAISVSEKNQVPRHSSIHGSVRGPTPTGREDGVSEKNLVHDRVGSDPVVPDYRSPSLGILNKGHYTRSNEQRAQAPFGRRPAPKPQKDRPKHDRAPWRKHGSMPSEIADSQDGTVSPRPRPASIRSSARVRTPPPRVSRSRSPQSTNQSESGEDTAAARRSASARSVMPRATVQRDVSTIMAAAARTTKRF
jgi:hypothetical protein